MQRRNYYHRQKKKKRKKENDEKEQRSIYYLNVETEYVMHTLSQNLHISDLNELGHRRFISLPLELCGNFF